jgi:hypothetical protein
MLALNVPRELMIPDFKFAEYAVPRCIVPIFESIFATLETGITASALITASEVSSSP